MHHYFDGNYVGFYAAELAWRENYRRVSNGMKYAIAVEAVAAASRSRQWCSYWQRSRV